MRSSIFWFWKRTTLTPLAAVKVENEVGIPGEDQKQRREEEFPHELHSIDMKREIKEITSGVEATMLQCGLTRRDRKCGLEKLNQRTCFS